MFLVQGRYRYDNVQPVHNAQCLATAAAALAASALFALARRSFCVRSPFDDAIAEEVAQFEAQQTAQGGVFHVVDIDLSNNVAG